MKDNQLLWELIIGDNQKLSKWHDSCDWGHVDRSKMAGAPTCLVLSYVYYGYISMFWTLAPGLFWIGSFE